jgi:hypothetical protein
VIVGFVVVRWTYSFGGLDRIVLEVLVLVVCWEQKGLIEGSLILPTCTLRDVGQ